MLFLKVRAQFSNPALSELGGEIQDGLNDTEKYLREGVNLKWTNECVVTFASVTIMDNGFSII